MRANTHNQRGAVMLFALMILAVMAAVGFVISSLVYREVNVSRSFDDSLQSYYAAETGIERALDIVTAHRVAHESLASTLTAIEAYPPSIPPFALSGSDASYAIDATQTASTITSLHIPLVDLYQIDLYDPDNSVTALSDAESVRLLWSVPSDCAGSSRMELTFQQFSSGAFGLADESVYKQVYTYGVETPSAGYDCQATSNWPAVNTNYVVQIRSLDCENADAQVTFYTLDDALGVEFPIPSYITIASVGTGDLSQREIIARTKWIPSASGLSSFVLFSQDGVTH
jgi:hypothetical protein